MRCVQTTNHYDNGRASELENPPPYEGHRVVSMLPEAGVIQIDESRLSFTMTPERIHQVLGKPERVLDDGEAYQYICELYSGGGVMLRYCGLESETTYAEDMTLCEMMVSEKSGWRVDVGGLSVFNKDQLSELKTKYKHSESAGKKALVFPTLGLLGVGCGEEETIGFMNRGKTAFLCNDAMMRFYISIIASWDCRS